MMMALSFIYPSNLTKSGQTSINIQTEPHNANNELNSVHFRVQGVLFKFNVKFKVKHHFQAL